MTTKAKETTAKEDVKVKEAETTTPTDEGAPSQKISEEQPETQIPDATFVEPTVEDSHDPKKLEFEDTDENNDILEKNEKMVAELVSPDTKVSFVSSATDLGVLQTAMVPHPLSGKPVYATAFQAALAQSLQGEL